MSSDIWERSIELIDCDDHFRTVKNTREAVEFLLTSWSGQKGPAYAAARKACLRALEGKKPDIDPQAAFIAAAAESGILRAN
ncbi:DUF982 domain-containing protein [Rhizobium sp. SEMIA 4085]|uniref:DUF982 domain-containing protein n=1 Tax=Rhizobium gallicum bv. gallicum R602sp TaxID=1041138 RepID=A0A0B4X426_9HYPH|nr:MULTISPECIES: DUF982 domain-containing protein [Rhizobium]AJD41292.1 hypothetical protein RGR602_CH01962 [Rhizobium gallicum bv. gallicum R602sp]NNH31383.1 DUF982 domain-containing protein [Rhizobium sp. SEMIA 4085]